MATPITPLARSIYEATDDAEARRVLDELTRTVAAESDWNDRLDLLVGALQMLASGLDEGGQEEGEQEDGELDDEPEADDQSDEDDLDDDDVEVYDLGGESVFQVAMPALIGAVLERLQETEVSSLPQAAMYVLSAHAEHQDAAMTWLQADEARMREFRTFLEQRQDYRELFEGAVADQIDEE